MSEEEWRVIPSDQLYRVSSLGRIYSTLSNKILRPSVNKNSGHLHVVLSRRKTRKVHALVLEAFVGPYPPGREIRHLDGDPSNNTLLNLVYGTRSENSYDRGRHGVDHNVNKSHCPRGHAYDEGNTRAYLSNGLGHRSCKSCERIRYEERAALVRSQGLPESVSHGSGVYDNWGCRCEVCRAGKAARYQRAVARRAAAA